MRPRIPLKLLILDEPTSSLDAARAHELSEYLRRRTREGLAVVFIGHKLGEILELAEDILVMRDGRLVWSGPRPETDHEKLVTLMSAEMLGREKAKAGPAVALQSVAGTPAPLVEIAGSWRENAKFGPLKCFAEKSSAWRVWKVVVNNRCCLGFMRHQRGREPKSSGGLPSRTWPVTVGKKASFRSGRRCRT